MEEIRGGQERWSSKGSKRWSGEEVRRKARSGGYGPERRSLEEVYSGGDKRLSGEVVQNEGSKRWSGEDVRRKARRGGQEKGEERMSGERGGEEVRRKARRGCQ